MSKTHLHKIEKLGGFLGRLSESLSKSRLLLVKDVLKPLAKRVLIPLELTSAVSAADAAIHKKFLDLV